MLGEKKKNHHFYQTLKASFKQNPEHNKPDDEGLLKEEKKPFQTSKGQKYFLSPVSLKSIAEVISCLQLCL